MTLAAAAVKSAAARKALEAKLSHVNKELGFTTKSAPAPAAASGGGGGGASSASSSAAAAAAAQFEEEMSWGSSAALQAAMRYSKR